MVHSFSFAVENECCGTIICCTDYFSACPLSYEKEEWTVHGRMRIDHEAENDSQTNSRLHSHRTLWSGRLLVNGQPTS